MNPHSGNTQVSLKMKPRTKHPRKSTLEAVSSMNARKAQLVYHQTPKKAISELFLKIKRILTPSIIILVKGQV